MKLTLKNKFFWMKASAFALVGFALVAGKAQQMGVPVALDPRIRVASVLAPEVAKGLNEATNYLWNYELENKVHKTVGVVEFDNAGDGLVSEAWEDKEDKNWQLVKHTDWHTYYKEKFGEKYIWKY